MKANTMDLRPSFDCSSDIEEQEDSSKLQEDHNVSMLDYLASSTKGGEESVELRACPTADTDDMSDDGNGPSGNQLPDVEEYKASMGHRGKVGIWFGMKRPDPPIEVPRDGGFREEHHLDGLLRELQVEEELDPYPAPSHVHKFEIKPVVNAWYCRCCPRFSWIPLSLLLLATILIPSIMSGTGSWSRRHRFPQVVKFLVENRISLRSDLEQEGSPQYQAALWIADQDKFQAALPRSKNEQEMADFYLTFVERYVFAVLYFALDGPTSWKYPMKFLSPNHICTWYNDYEEAEDAQNAFETEEFVTMGVRACGLVGDELVPVALHLPGNGLKGEIPNEIQYLDRLEVLTLPYNPGLTGPIPTALKGMAGLRHLALQYCNFTGTVGDWMGEMTNLEYLGLGSNHLTGAIPQSIQKLTNLKVLGLDRNSLGGNIELFHPLANLKSLLLESNHLSGTISNGLLASWPDLIDLDLSKNKLKGSLPDELFLHENILRVLDLHGNAFTGGIPSQIPEEWDLAVLALQDNSFSSTVPESIGNLKTLEHLDISGNSFTGTLPTTMAEMTELRYLFTGGNDFVDSRLPSFVQQLTNLQELSMKSNRLTGQLPEFVRFLTNMQLMDMHDNELTGSIPAMIGFMSKLEHLLLNNNKLTGQLPSELDHLTKLQLLLVDGNSLVGSADHLCKSLALQHFVSDCGGDTPEVDCNCCDLCCVDTDDTCNSFDWVGNVDPTWEYGFTNGHYDQGPEVWLLP